MLRDGSGAGHLRESAERPSEDTDELLLESQAAEPEAPAEALQPQHEPTRAWRRPTFDTRMKATLLAGAALALSAIVLVVATLGPGGPSASPAPGGQSGTTGPGASGPAATAGEAGAKPSASPAASPEPPHDDTLPTAGWAGAGADLPPVALVARLAPEKTYPRGISPTASFTLASLTETPAAKLAAGLTADPPVAFTVKKGVDPQVVTLQPAAALETGRQYRFTLRTNGLLAGSWIFQTAQPPRVVGTLPHDTATLVPVDTGIEFVFDQDGVLDPSSQFSIEPTVSGRFEQHGRAWVFVPERDLAWSTVYRVTLRKGVRLSGSDQVLAGDVTFAFETRQKPQPSQPKPVVPEVWLPSPAREVVEVNPSEPPIIPFEPIPASQSKTGPPRLDVAVHRFASLAEAHDAFGASRGAPDWALWSEQGLVDTAGLLRVASFAAALESTEGIRGSWVRFPDPLERGWYLVVFGRDGRDLQVFLQVTDIATYAAVTTTKTLVWVNDVTTGKAVAGASVRYLGMELLGRTDAEGVTSGTTPEVVRSSRGGTLLVRAPDAGPLEQTKPGRAAFVPVGLATGRPYLGNYTGGYDEYLWDVGSEHWADEVDAGDVLHHLSIDRWAYRKTDQVDVWGFVRSRTTGRTPTSVSLTISAQDWDSTTPSLGSATAKVDPATGTFMASLPFTDLPYGDYVINATVDGQTLGTQWLEVREIVKPAYRIAVKADRHVVIDGDPVVVTASATFFEDTPAAGVAMTVQAFGRQVVRTDSTGTAAFTETAHAAGYVNWESLSAWPARGGEYDIPVRGDNVTVYPSSIWIETGAVFKGSRLQVSTAATTVDARATERAKDAGTWDGDPLGVSAAGVTLTVQLTEETLTRISTGRQYSFIEKRAVDTYRYETNERKLDAIRVTTGRDGTAQATIPVRADVYAYSGTVTVTDRSGRTMQTSFWEMRPQGATSSSWPTRSYDNEWPHLGDWSSGCGSYWGDYSGDSAEFRLGAATNVPFRDGDGSLMPQGGPNRYLFFLSQGGLLDAQVQASPVFGEPYRSEWIPNVGLGAVRFTGTTYIPAVAPFELVFDYDQRRLDVTVATGAERYRPGGTATVSVTAKDEEGRPVDATVIVRVIDEKLYEMGLVDQSDPLPDLYARLSSGILTTYLTHQLPVAYGRGCYDNGCADGCDTTGGGDGYPLWREDFRDVLLFARIRTGTDGRASTSFDLSDDLTSWRVSAAAVTAEMEAGTDEHTFAVGLPFFIEAPVQTAFVVGDRPAIRIRTYGTALSEASRLMFTVAVPSLGMTAQTVRTTGYRSVEVPLPEMRVGDHEVRITASMTSGGKTYQDALVRMLHVVETRFTDRHTVVANLRSGLPVAMGAGWTEYRFSDGGRGQYMSTLYELAYGGGERLDAALAADLAAQTLREDFDLAEDLPTAGFSGSPYQRDGGIALLPYAAPDLALSARVALTAPDRFWEDGLSEYFTQVSDGAGETRERRAIALAGMAGLGVPFLDRIRTMLADPELTIREQAYLALGAAVLGDHDTALAVEQALLRAHGERFGQQLRLRVGSSLDDTLEATALVALIAAIVGDPAGQSAQAYLEGNRGHDDLFLLQQASFIDRVLDRLPAGKGSFAYTLEGKRHLVNLEEGGSFSLRLTPTQREGFSAERTKGEVTVAVTYTAPVDLADVSTDPSITLERRIVPQPPVTGTAPLQVQLRARFAPQAVERCHWVTDTVPSGLVTESRWLELGGIYESDAIGPWWTERDRVTFCVWPSKERVVTMAYWVRVVMPGTYRWEPALMHASGAPDHGVVVPATTLVIR